MRLKSQDRDYQLKRDEEREKKAQLRARQDLDQLSSVTEFSAGDQVDARFGRGWFPGIVEKGVEGGYSIRWDEDGTYNEVLCRDVRKRTADDMNAWHLEDLGSVNGTVVNGARVRGNRKVRVVEGDVIIIGSKTSSEARYRLALRPAGEDQE